MTNYEEACEARDAAVQNSRAGNVEQAIKHAAMATMFLMFDAVEAGEAHDADAARSGRIALPYAPGVYADADGHPWYRSAVDSIKPWMLLATGHSDDRWFTEGYAAQYAPFTRMEAVA